MMNCIRNNEPTEVIPVGFFFYSIPVCYGMFPAVLYLLHSATMLHFCKNKCAMQAIPFYQVDAFTTTPFKGNPAAVCLLEAPLPYSTMQAIAMENNLSETAFLLQENNGYRLSWFTPTSEVKLCGHGTLASAHVLWEQGLSPVSASLHFHTRSGELLASRTKDGAITLDFPVADGQAIVLNERLSAAIPARIVQASFHKDRYVVELEDADTVKQLQPDYRVFKQEGGVIVTARGGADSPYDFISRYFTPHKGIDEDPVTGSAHCCLAAYWAPLLGKTDFFAYQASARGGEMRVVLNNRRVLMTGNAVTVIEGKLLSW